MSDSPNIYSVPEELIPIICGAIGRLVFNWSFLESNLDAWSSIIFHLAEGKTIEKMLQRNLGRKVEFLERCFKRLNPLKSYSGEALALLADADRLSVTRHSVVHGILSYFDDQKHSVTFRKLAYIENYTRHQIEPFTIAVPDLIAQAHECGAIAIKMVPISQRLLHEFVPENERHKLPSSVRRQTAPIPLPVRKE